MRAHSRWHDWAIFSTGLWLAVSPWLVGYASEPVPTANAAIVGLALAFTAHIEASCELSIEWVDLGVGVWLVMAPFVLGFHELAVASANCVAVGAAVAALAASSLDLQRHLIRR